MFAHGFNLLYGGLAFPADADVVLVSPTGPGRVLRGRASAATRLPAYLAVHRDASGAGVGARRALRRRARVRARCWRTTVREETEVDLFGEQAVLCGGMNALVRAAFETLVAHGYSPEIAYLECVHQLKYLADLLHERGVGGLRRGHQRHRALRRPDARAAGDRRGEPRGDGARCSRRSAAARSRASGAPRSRPGGPRLDAAAAPRRPRTRSRTARAAGAWATRAGPGERLAENRATPCPKTD